MKQKDGKMKAKKAETVLGDVNELVYTALDIISREEEGYMTFALEAAQRLIELARTDRSAMKEWLRWWIHVEIWPDSRTTEEEEEKAQKGFERRVLTAEYIRSLQE